MATTTDLFDEYFRRADVDGNGRISGQEAVSFFRGANLSRDVLQKIWAYVDQGPTGSLSKSEFYDALKLATIAQFGKELTPTLVEKALRGSFASRIPAPQIQFPPQSFPVQTLDLTQNLPKMTDAIVRSYAKKFFELDPDMDGKINGNKAHNIFLSWKISQVVLKEIWRLSDQDCDGMLSIREFCVACYLIERHRENYLLPEAISSALCFDESGVQALVPFEILNQSSARQQEPLCSTSAGYLPKMKEVKTLNTRLEALQEKAMFFFDTDILDCGVCMEVLKPPIYQCENGHYACTDCLGKMDAKCHVCRALVCKTNRNLGLEKILQTLKRKCMFSNQGCKRMLPYLDMTKHENKCGCAPHTCLLPHCSFCGPLNGMSAHFQDSHNIRTIKFSYGRSFAIPSIDLAHEQHVLLVSPDLPFLLCCHDYHELGKMLYISSFCVNSIQEPLLSWASMSVEASDAAYTYNLCVISDQDAKGSQTLQGAIIRRNKSKSFACLNCALLSAEGIDFLLVPNHYAFNKSSSQVLVEINLQLG